jgi:hypothetical protein
LPVVGVVVFAIAAGAEVPPPDAMVACASVCAAARVAVWVVGSRGGGVGARRMTDGGGSHGSRGLSTGTGAKSVVAVAVSVPDALPAVRTALSEGVTPATSLATESLIATVVIAVSVPTTPVETTSLITTPESVGDACRMVCGVLVESVATTAVESAAGSSSVGFAAGSSSRMRNAPTPRLRNAAIPTPFQTYGPIGVFSGGVPHHLHAPALSG